MEVEKTQLRDCLVIHPKVWGDARGFFMETYRQDRYAEAGIQESFVQDNQSRSAKGVVRGLHFQWDPPQGKLMRVSRGAAFVVAVDIRPDSPTRGQWFGTVSSSENKVQVWAPAGFARGFCALEDCTEVQYKCTGLYNPACESGILWNDPEVGIAWPLADVHLSAKDAAAQTLKSWLARPEARHFAGA
jgi:dTDP-4-dehydrorhamnose 3,5-epimerase